MKYRYLNKATIEKEQKLPPSELAAIGSNELFESNVSSQVPAIGLLNRCKVWSIAEYDKHPEYGPQDYYTRASYDVYLVRPLFDPA
jgi:hypothetical protein